MNVHDELPHPIGDHPAWSESYYFNFVDPTSTIGMFTRMGFRSGDGWADGLHAVYLGGDRVVFCYGRRDIAPGDQELTVGGLTLTLDEPFKRWTVSYDGPCQDVADGPVMVTPRKERPEGWYAPAHLSMSVTFDALAEPHYAASGERGHFEQTGHVTGHIQVGDERWEVDGYGVRDKSWGPRTWSSGDAGGRDDETAAAPSSGTGGGTSEPTGSRLFTTWFSGNFGADLAFGGTCVRTRSGAMRGAGWLQREGRTVELTDLTVESEFGEGSMLHRSCRLTGRTPDGATVEIDGDVLTICPTKIPMPGGATLVNEGLARFRSDGVDGYGIAEYWHSVQRG